MQLCGYIASSNLAELVVGCDSIGIRIEKARSGVVQLFTPRNAWGFEMTRSFESKPSSLVVGFLDESKGYVEVERRVSVDDDGSISFDTVSQSDADSLRIDSFGVTSADHAARLGAQKLKLLHSQTRTYSWKSDIEGIVCLPGDVVLIENDNFLLGLGEGRIKEIVREGASATGFVLDSKVRMLSEGSYGVTVRTSSGVFPSIPVETDEGEVFAFRFKEDPPSGMGLSVGDLVSFGEYRKEAHRVLITEMTPDQNRSCTFKAVDYVEDAYSPESSIPAFDSGLSKYPDDGGSVGASFGWSVPRYEIHGTQGKDGEDGLSFTVVIESSNGDVFRPGDISTTLTCRVYLNTAEVTDDIPESKFNWRRNTGDELEDEKWNTSSKAVGHRSVDITSADCNGRTVFDCDVELPEI